MPVVYIPALLRPLAAGQSSVEVEGSTVAELIDNLDRLWPGIRGRLVEEGRLLPNLCVAIDGEVSPAGLREKVGESSEVHFVAAIKGGAAFL